MDLDGAVAAEQQIVEEDRHFRYERGAAHVSCGDGHGCHEVLAPVGTEFGDRSLCAGEHDRDVDAVEEEAERRGRVGHGVGAVEHDNTRVPGGVLDDRVGDRDPVRRCHGR